MMLEIKEKNYKEQLEEIILTIQKEREKSMGSPVNNMYTKQ